MLKGDRHNNEILTILILALTALAIDLSLLLFNEQRR